MRIPSISKESYLKLTLMRIFLLQDVFHAQLIAGDLTGNLKKYLPYIGMYILCLFYVS